MAVLIIITSNSLNLGIVKNKLQPQSGVAYAKPHITKPHLNHIFGFPRNGILNLSIRNCLVSTRKVTCWTDPCHLQEKVTLQ